MQDRGFAHYLAEFDGGAYAGTFADAEFDVHWTTARALGLVADGAARDKGNKAHAALREGAKSFRYAFLYGVGSKTAGRIISDSIRAATRIDGGLDLQRKIFGGAAHPSEAALARAGKQALGRFETATPGLRSLRGNLQAQVRRRGWLVGLDGRRVPVRADYTALNYAVTSSEAIICKRWLVGVYDELCRRFRYGRDGDVVITLWVHDELVCECRPESADLVGEILVRHAIEPGAFYGFRAPLKAEYTVGKSWAGEAAASPTPLSVAPAPPPVAPVAPLTANLETAISDQKQPFEPVFMAQNEDFEPVSPRTNGHDTEPDSSFKPGPEPEPAAGPNGRDRKPETCRDAALRYMRNPGWFVFEALFRWDKKKQKWAKQGRFSGDDTNGNPWGYTRDLSDVERYGYWRKPGAPIGIPCGPVNGIFVVEADTVDGHGVDGLASLAALEAAHGKLPETLMARSPSGSVHRYFRYPAGVYIPGTGTLPGAVGVDVLGDGGMVVAPPSYSPKYKARYVWINEGAPDRGSAGLARRPCRQGARARRASGR